MLTRIGLRSCTFIQHLTNKMRYALISPFLHQLYEIPFLAMYQQLIVHKFSLVSIGGGDMSIFE